MYGTKFNERKSKIKFKWCNLQQIVVILAKLMVPLAVIKQRGHG